ncbi:MAG TPA: DMT family transporter [Trinickia sp.]
MRLAVLYGVLAALIWAGQPIVSKFGYHVGITAVDQTFLRYATSGLLLLPFIISRCGRNAFGLGWKRAALLMLAAGPLYSLILIGGLAWAPASHSALIYPALTPIFSALLMKRLAGRSEHIPLPGLALLVAGVVFIGLANLFHQQAQPLVHAWRGDLLFALAALVWAVYLLLVRRWKADPFTVVGIVQMSAALYVLPYLAWKGVSVFHADWRQLALQALYHGVGVSIVAVTLINLAVRALGAKASMFTALVPPFGVGFAIVLLGEPATLPLLVGTGAIATGLAWSLIANARGVAPPVAAATASPE